MSDRALHVVVVGVGIVGAAIAEALSLEGIRVTVVDRGTAGGGATGAGMGHIVVMDDSEAQVALTAHSQRLWDERAHTLPPAGERQVRGTLWIAADDEEMAEVHRKHTFYRQRGIAAEILDAEQLKREEPVLRPGLSGGLLVPGDSVLYPPPIVDEMLETVWTHGGEVKLGRAVVSMTGNEVRLKDETLACDFAVNATGVGAGTLTTGCDIRARKGHLVITDRYPGFVRHQLVELGYLKSAHSNTQSSVAFNVQPRPTGQVLIGSSRQFNDASPEINFSILTQMLRRAVEYIPAISDLIATRAWTGFRAATPDKLPLIGPHPDDPHLVLATGHEGLGITTSLGTARLVVDYIVGRTSAIPIAPYLPARNMSVAAHAN